MSLFSFSVTRSVTTFDGYTYRKMSMKISIATTCRKIIEIDEPDLSVGKNVRYSIEKQVSGSKNALNYVRNSDSFMKKMYRANRSTVSAEFTCELFVA